MKKLICVILIIPFLFMTACSSESNLPDSNTSKTSNSNGESLTDAEKFINLNDSIVTVDAGLTATSFKGDDSFEDFLKAGGASTDKEVLNFLMTKLLADSSDSHDLDELDFNIAGIGCSTLSVANDSNDGYYFGRNFDWYSCNAMILASYPDNGYSSITTVNTDFIKQAAALPLSDSVLKKAALYAPLDGMNEKGLCASVNMIEDSVSINQKTDKADITTTTAIRLLMNKAANVDEAVELLKSYDMHSSFGYMVHFAIADASGKSVAVEYVNGEMSVIESQVLTNFYLTEGDKYGIGTSQSHTRFNILTEALNADKNMSMSKVKDVLSSVSKGNFGEFESTEWSVIYDQKNMTARYYHRENYDKSYSVKFDGGGNG